MAEHRGASSGEWGETKKRKRGGGEGTLQETSNPDVARPCWLGHTKPASGKLQPYSRSSQWTALFQLSLSRNPPPEKPYRAHTKRAKHHRRSRKAALSVQAFQRSTEGRDSSRRGAPESGVLHPPSMHPRHRAPYWMRITYANHTCVPLCLPACLPACLACLPALPTAASAGALPCLVVREECAR